MTDLYNAAGRALPSTPPERIHLPKDDGSRFGMTAPPVPPMISLLPAAPSPLRRKRIVQQGGKLVLSET